MVFECLPLHGIFVLTEIFLLMDKYDLYGKIAIPKKHDFEHEVPGLYRIAAEKKGIFVNSALTEPFGLTLIEAAASGLPIVATEDGGPQDIIANCKNGELVDPLPDCRHRALAAWKAGATVALGRRTDRLGRR